MNQVRSDSFVGVERSELEVGEGSLEEGTELVAYAKTCEEEEGKG